MAKKKIIVTDVDGVLLNWEDAFQVWMQHQGFEKVKKHKFIYNAAEQFGLSLGEGKKWVRLFNQSAAIGFLPPLRDAQEIVKLLNNNYGYRFVICTSLSLDKAAQELRTRNLKKIFGDVFEEFVYLDTGADKDDALLPYANSDCWWIEDKPKNAELGASYGLQSILVAHDHNAYYDGDIPRYWKWKDIYKHITGEI